MKKLLLSASALMLALGATAQNPDNLVEEMDGATPCFLSWSPAGAFQGAAGHDFTSMTWNSTDGTMEFAATTHASAHGPLYYTLSAGDATTCDAAKGAVDLTTENRYEIKAKASVPMQVNVYIQEGNAPSYDYSKFSESFLQMDLTTSFQVFKKEGVTANNLAATSTIDITNIGTVAFELGKTDGTNYDNVSGATVTIDYIRFGSAVTSFVNINAATGVTVYPNPATDVVNVNVGTATNATIELTDVTGKVVASVSGVSGSTAINTANIPAGLYVVSVKSANGVSTSKVVVK